MCFEYQVCALLEQPCRVSSALAADNQLFDQQFRQFHSQLHVQHHVLHPSVTVASLKLQGKTTQHWSNFNHFKNFNKTADSSVKHDAAIQGLKHSNVQYASINTGKYLHVHSLT